VTRADAPKVLEYSDTDDRGALGALLSPYFFIRQLPLAMLFLGVAGASWAPYTPMEATLLQRLVPAAIRGHVFGARHSLAVAAAPLGAAFVGVLLQYLSAPLVIAISGLACILAGLGGLVSPSLCQLQRRKPLMFRQGMNTDKEICAT
jgi:MFS family permease